MKIVYDISMLGLGYSSSALKTGLFRVVENLAYGLIASKEVNLTFCSTLSLDIWIKSLEYLTVNSDFNEILFISQKYQQNYRKNLYKYLSKNRLLNSNSLSVFLRKIFYKIIEFNFQTVSWDDLKTQNIFHSPFHPLPEITKKGKSLKRFLTVHDLIQILYPHFCWVGKRFDVKKSLTSLTPDDWIFCVSNSTKNDLCDYMSHIDPEKIFVTYLAASELFYPSNDPDKLALVRKKYQLPDEPYILSLCTLEPRKNIEHVIRCFGDLVQQENIQELYLVLVGSKGWKYERIFEVILNYPLLKERIILTGYVADEDLAAIYSGALLFVYPSFYEGFGLPPLEAMQCGIPVITSNTSSLPEVVGEAGIMLDPLDSDGLCHSMLEIYNQPSLRDALSSKSIEQAKQFSWSKCTQQTIAAYKTALLN
jgi:glycosyltransferase involved in cell wall biosynthesis